jgi:hypothetical protein
VQGDIARWKDVYTPPAALVNALIDNHPYLGPGFTLMPRAGAAHDLHGLFAFNYSALISFGLSASAISGLKYALPKLAGAIADQLFLDDRDAMLHDYLNYAEMEFVGEWPQKGKAG